MKFTTCIFNCFLFVCSSATANECYLDLSFEKTFDYKDYQMQLQKNNIEKQDNKYSLLPDIYLSTGQSAYNKSGFKSPEYSNAGIYISQSIFSGGRYFMTNDKLTLSDSLQLLSLERNRINYILSVYEKLLKRREIHSLLNFYKVKQDNAKMESKRLEYMFKHGQISEFEFNLKENISDNYKKNIKSLKNELQQLEWALHKEHHLSQKFFDIIDSGVIKSCKKIDVISLIKEENTIELEEIKLGYNLEKSVYYPSVSLSLSLTPKKGGAIRDISIRDGNYGTSINLSIPLSGMFKLTSNKERLLLNLSSSQLNIDKRKLDLEKIKTDSLNKLNNSINELISLRKQLLLNQKKVEYLKNQLYKSNGNIISYYNELDVLNELERKKLSKENEIELYKMHIFYIG